jgi:carboxymethylenebutenolidase
MSTPAGGAVERRVTFSSNSSECKAYEALPSRPGPGLVLIQEWWGLVPHIAAVADRLAEAGFVTIAPDLYHGETTSAPDEADRMMMQLEMAQAARDLAGAVSYLLEHPRVVPRKVGVVGFCMGGALSLVLATVAPIDATVVFYGLPYKGEPEYANLASPVLGHWAEEDRWWPADEAREVFDRLRALGKDVTLEVYPGTRHGFFNDELPHAYDPAAAEVAWTRTIGFLRAHLAEA